jgi:hypothetical protein
MQIADEIGRRFALTAEERETLSLGPATMSRRQRRIYHTAIEPRLHDFRAYLEGELRRAGTDGRKRWATTTAFAIIARGYASVADQLVIDLVGRRAVSAVMDAARGRPSERPVAPC